MNQEREIELAQDTKIIRELIAQVDSSGISAWNAGDVLKSVKDKKNYVPKFKTFEKYTKKEVGINPQTANNYISIRESFDFNEVKDLMLVTHLKAIAQIKNDKIRKIVLQKFKDIENESKKGTTAPYKISLQDVIGAVTMVLESNTTLSDTDIEQVVRINIEKGQEEKSRRLKTRSDQKGSDDKPKFGNLFFSEYFKDITALMENEPINEMGVVALFCLMFQSLRGTQFSWKNEVITFVAIKYVRVEFPDACIRCKSIGKEKKNFELDIEFEFESYNYIRHKHSQSSKKCDLIICWEENAKTDTRLKENNAVKSMPPVLSLKKCFQTGEIELLE